MKNRIYIVLGVILCISFATSCSENTITSYGFNNGENDSSYNNGNLSDNTNSASNNNGNNNQTVLESEIPASFYYNKVKYISVSCQGIDLRNKKNEMLGYLINETDVENFKVEQPNDNYVVVDHIYSRTYNNRVPFFSVIGYDDYEYIIVQSLTLDLYQNTSEFS